MRILFLTKRQYMGKDLLQDRFGRFYELPRALALHGHQIRGVCFKYWANGVDAFLSRHRFDNVEWESFQLGWNWPAGFFSHYFRLKDIADDFRPELIIGASDPMHLIFASWLSKRMGVPLAVDLYDDFESYGTARLPGIKKGMQHAIGRAVAISTVSTNLEAKIKSRYRLAGIVRTVTNAVCPDIFRPTDKKLARRKLGLPENELLIGTAGALSKARGIKAFFQAFEQLSSKRSAVSLILAGRLDRRLRLPDNQKVRYLGELEHREVGHLFNALDVGVVCNGRNQFAEFCFPQKLYEMSACRLPVVAANIGVMRQIFAGVERCLYDPESTDSLARAIEKQLDAPKPLNITIPTWRKRGEDFQRLLMDALTQPYGVDSFMKVAHA